MRSIRSQEREKIGFPTRVANDHSVARTVANFKERSSNSRPGKIGTFFVHNSETLAGLFSRDMLCKWIMTLAVFSDERGSDRVRATLGESLMGPANLVVMRFTGKRGVLLPRSGTPSLGRRPHK